MAASDWPGFALAAAAGTLRTGALFGFQAFIPLYVWRTLDSSEGVGNIAIAAMLAAGALGTLCGGRLSDIHGFRRVVVLSLLASVPLALVDPRVPLLALLPVLALFGLISEMNFYPLVVLAQRALPRHVGFASGVTLGLSIGLGSLASPLLGLVADHTSLRTALFGAAVLTVARRADLARAAARPRHEHGLRRRARGGRGAVTAQLVFETGRARRPAVFTRSRAISTRACSRR